MRMLKCGANPVSYLDYGYNNEFDITNDDPVMKCLTSNCATSGAGCLFDILSDPCEYNDVSSQYPDVAKYLRSRLFSYNLTQLEPLQSIVATAPLEKYDPINYNNYWTPFFQGKVEFELLLKADFQTKEKKYKSWLLANDNFDAEISIKESILSKNNNNITHNTNNFVLLIIGIVIFFCLITYCVKKIYNMQLFCKNDNNNNNNNNAHNNNTNDHYSRISNDEIIDITTKQFCERSPLLEKQNK